jgi:hypothetical protein
MAYGGTMRSKLSVKYEVAPAHTHHEFEQLRELQDQIAMLIAIVGAQQKQITKLQQLQR